MQRHLYPGARLQHTSHSQMSSTVKKKKNKKKKKKTKTKQKTKAKKEKKKTPPRKINIFLVFPFLTP
jgi:hypothetical protein